MKKKIIIIIAVIAIITAIFALSASAFEYGEVIEKDSIITFSNDIILTGQNFRLIMSGTTNNGVVVSDVYIKVNSLEYEINGTNQTVYNNGQWVNDDYKSLKLTSDYSIPSGTDRVVNFLNANATVYKPPLDNVLDNVNSIWSFVLSSGTVIVNFVGSNALAALGIYLYVLVVILLVIKRFIKE